MTHNSPLLRGLTTAWYGDFFLSVTAGRRWGIMEFLCITLHHWRLTTATVWATEYEKYEPDLHCKHVSSMSMVSNVLLRGAMLVNTSCVPCGYLDTRKTNRQTAVTDGMTNVCWNGVCSHLEPDTWALAWKNAQNWQRPFYCLRKLLNIAETSMTRWRLQISTVYTAGKLTACWEMVDSGLVKIGETVELTHS